MHVQPAEIAATLGLPGSTTLLDLSVHCENGLPVDSLHALARAASPNEQAFVGTLFSKSTLRRRQQRGKLTAEESDLLVRLAAIWLMARDTLGDEKKAQRFLMTEHSLLGGRRPVDLAKTNSPGAQAVEQLLGRLKYGSAA